MGGFRPALAGLLLIAAVLGAAGAILPLAVADRAEWRLRPAAQHLYDLETAGWFSVASSLAAHLYVETQKSILIGSAAAFAIGGAWTLCRPTTRRYASEDR